MKRFLLIFALCMASFTLAAQSHLSYSIEFIAGVGVGVGKGPQALFTPEFVAQYGFDGGFRIGAGAGTRFARPCFRYITRNGSHSRSFCNELDIPVFMRLGYGKEKIYANLDAGYAIGALSFYGLDWIPGGKKDPSFNGFFVEPQVGWKVGRRSALALGLLFQQSTVSNQVITENGTLNDPSYSVGEEVTTLNILTQAVTLRYVLGF